MKNYYEVKITELKISFFQKSKKGFNFGRSKKRIIDCKKTDTYHFAKMVVGHLAIGVDKVIIEKVS